MNAVTRMISLSLRSGVKIEEIDDQLKGINCPACSMSRAKGNKIDGLSCPDIIASTIKQFVKDDIRPANNMATRNTDSNKGVAYETPKLAVKSVENTKDKCPECGALLTRSGGCYTCLSCGYSKCGD
jgi:ribonucleoside-diphosphate reductase alpha chain